MDHARWAEAYGVVQRLVQDAIGNQVLEIHHVEAMALPGLIAKPVLDIDLTGRLPSTSGPTYPRCKRSASD